MRIPFFNQHMALPFDGFQEHAEKVKECAWAFQQAIECFFSKECRKLVDYMNEVDRLETEADEIKVSIRRGLSNKSKLPVDKFQLFLYIQEQDKVLDCVEDCLNWISYHPNSDMPEALRKQFFDLVDSVIAPIEEVSHMVIEAKKYFADYSERQRRVVTDIIRSLHESEHEADRLEDSLKSEIFTTVTDPITVYHLVELAQRIGAIADHAENTGDIMRAMIEVD